MEESKRGSAHSRRNKQQEKKLGDLETGVKGRMEDRNGMSERERRVRGSKVEEGIRRREGELEREQSKRKGNRGASKETKGRAGGNVRERAERVRGGRGMVISRRDRGRQERQKEAR